MLNSQIHFGQESAGRSHNTEAQENCYHCKEQNIYITLNPAKSCPEHLGRSRTWTWPAAQENRTTVAVLIHIPGNWESVSILGREPSHIWGMKRKRVHFFLIFSLSQRRPLPFPPTVIDRWAEEAQSRPQQPSSPTEPAAAAVTACVGAPGMLAGTHRHSKDLCFRKNSQTDLWASTFLIFE